MYGTSSDRAPSTLSFRRRPIARQHALHIPERSRSRRPPVCNLESTHARIHISHALMPLIASSWLLARCVRSLSPCLVSSHAAHLTREASRHLHAAPLTWLLARRLLTSLLQSRTRIFLANVSRSLPPSSCTCTTCRSPAGTGIRWDDGRCPPPVEMRAASAHAGTPCRRTVHLHHARRRVRRLFRSTLATVLAPASASASADCQLSHAPRLQRRPTRNAQRSVRTSAVGPISRHYRHR